MKKTILTVLVLALILCGCGSAPRVVTGSMKAAMTEYAEWTETEYPNEPINVAKVCADMPSGVYWNDEIGGYIVTCKIPNAGKAYGIVFMDDFAVTSTCTVDANTQKELAGMLSGLGYE